jgi:hypothetical protein
MKGLAKVGTFMHSPLYNRVVSHLGCATPAFGEMGGAVGSIPPPTAGKLAGISTTCGGAWGAVGSWELDWGRAGSCSWELDEGGRELAGGATLGGRGEIGRPGGSLDREPSEAAVALVWILNCESIHCRCRRVELCSVRRPLQSPALHWEQSSSTLLVP